MSEERKSTIKLFAAILIVMFVFKVLSGDQDVTYGTYKDEDFSISDKLVKVSEEKVEESEDQEEKAPPPEKARSAFQDSFKARFTARP